MTQSPNPSQLHSERERQRSRFASVLLPVALLAVILWPAAATTAEAGPITCSFGSPPPSEGLLAVCPGTPTSRLYEYGLYEVEVDFAAFGGSVLRPFDLTIEDIRVEQADVADRLPPGVVCLPIAGLMAVKGCVEFHIVGFTPVQGVDFLGDFRIDVAWLAPTDPFFPDIPPGSVMLLHDSSLVPGDGFADITIPGSYFSFPPCVFPELDCDNDPGIGGRDDDFQSFLVGHQSVVPEPATLLLLGSGLGGLVYRARRRK